MRVVFYDKLKILFSDEKLFKQAPFYHRVHTTIKTNVEENTTSMVSMQDSFPLIQKLKGLSVILSIFGTWFCDCYMGQIFSNLVSIVAYEYIHNEPGQTKFSREGNKRKIKEKHINFFVPISHILLYYRG